MGNCIKSKPHPPEEQGSGAEETKEEIKGAEETKEEIKGAEETKEQIKEAEETKEQIKGAEETKEEIKGAEKSKKENELATNPPKKMEKDQEGSINEGSYSEEEIKEGRSVEETESVEKGEIAEHSDKTPQPKDSISGEPIVSTSGQQRASTEAKASASAQNKASISGQQKAITSGEQRDSSSTVHSEAEKTSSVGSGRPFGIDPKDSRANAAATRIQSLYRGYVIRKKLKEGELVSGGDEHKTLQKVKLSKERQGEPSQEASDSKSFKEKRSSEGKGATRKDKSKDKDKKKSKDKDSEKAKDKCKDNEKDKCKDNEKDKCKEMEKDTCKELAKAAAAKAIEKKKKKAKDEDKSKAKGLECSRDSSKEMETLCAESRISSKEHFSCRSLIESIRMKVSSSTSFEKRDKRKSKEASSHPRDDCCHDHEDPCGSNDPCGLLNVQNLTMLSSQSCFRRADDMGFEVDCPVCNIVSQEPSCLVADSSGCMASDRLTCPPLDKDLDCAYDKNEEEEDYACGTYDRYTSCLDDTVCTCCYHDNCSNGYC